MAHDPYVLERLLARVRVKEDEADPFALLSGAQYFVAIEVAGDVNAQRRVPPYQFGAEVRDGAPIFADNVG